MQSASLIKQRQPCRREFNSAPRGILLAKAVGSRSHDRLWHAGMHQQFYIVREIHCVVVILECLIELIQRVVQPIEVAAAVWQNVDLFGK